MTEYLKSIKIENEYEIKRIAALLMEIKLEGIDNKIIVQNVTEIGDILYRNGQ